MYFYETVIRTEHEAQRFTTAFYRFLELHSAPLDAAATMTSERSFGFEKRRISLWSEEAVRSFEGYLSSFHVPPPGGVVRIKRFDDLS